MASAADGADSTSSRKSWVKLNVGGNVFLTTKQTLLKEPESFLGRLAAEDPNLPSCQDCDGAYMIDRDAEYFAPVLNYLRHGKLITDDGVSLEGVLEEAKFYSIKSLISILEERLEPNPRQSGDRHHVYRVLQCKEEELAHHISNMSHGWKFEQLLSIGSNYNFGPDEQGEYLCIVSKDVCDPAESANGEEPTNFNPKVFQLRGT